MEQFIPQEETRRIIISDVVKKEDSIVSYSALTSMKERGYYGLSFLSQYSFDISWIRSSFIEG